MKRAFIMVLDSFGIGATEDAERFGDVGADTLGHIAEACAKGEADNGRKGPLNLPNLTRLGLAKAHEGSTGFIPACRTNCREKRTARLSAPDARHPYARHRSPTGG